MNDADVCECADIKRMQGQTGVADAGERLIRAKAATRSRHAKIDLRLEFRNAPPIDYYLKWYGRWRSLR